MEKSIPVKNYILLGVVVFATVVLLYLFVMFYQNRVDYKNSIETRMSFLSEVKEHEITNYILDNHDVILYISDSTDPDYLVFERQLKQQMLEENLNKNVVYMDAHKLSKDFFVHFQNDFGTIQDASVLPNVLVVEGGRITSVLYTKEQDKKVSDVVTYIKEYLE